jgi:hypothetical protein
VPIQDDVIAWWKQTFKSVAKTENVPTELVCREHYSAQDRIDSRTIAAAGQNTNARLHLRISKLEKSFRIS